MRTCWIYLWLFMSALLGECFSISAFADLNQSDPYQNFNRHAFCLNDGIDKAVYKPVASMYQAVLPNVAQRRVSDFFGNIHDISGLANDVLQAKVYQGTQDTWRVFFNTTFGLLGFFDVASKIGLPKHPNDFGMTLANWGYRNTNYFVIPFLGPSTVRDALGTGVDYEVLSIYPYIKSDRLRYSLVGLDLVQLRASLLHLQSVMDQAAVDPYIFQRDAYLQHRNYLLSQNLGTSAQGTGSNQSEDKDPYVAE